MGKDGKKSLSLEIPVLSDSSEGKMYELRRHGNTYKIFELKTKKYVAKFDNEEKAKDIIQKLNRGSAFDGNTPAFFTNGTSYGLDFTLKYDEEFS